MVPPNLRIWIQERNPSSAAEAGNLAENYLQARGRDSRVIQRSSQDSGFKGKALLAEVKKCYKGLFARNCAKMIMDSGGKKKVDKPVKCYNCGKNGHMSMSCPSKALLCGDCLLGELLGMVQWVRKQLMI